MCGVVGVIARTAVDPDRLEKALDALSSRGPDGQGRWWSPEGRVGLGHRRLAINDPQGGAQPLLCDRFAAVINGEFYELPESYRDRSDNWALLDRLQSQSMKATMASLNGEFAGLVYDHNNGSVTAFRDRFGVKPLYWGQLNGEIWFASKPAALWAAGFPGGWCEASFAQAASTQYPLPGTTLFRGIASLLPGHFLTVHNGNTSLQRYWQIPVGSPSTNGEQAFSRRLATAVQARVRKDHSTAVMLSGGIDSASVLALASRISNDVTAYSVDFVDQPGSSFSEGAQASAQARLCAVPHRVLSLSSSEILSLLPTVIPQLGGPVVNGHAVAKWKLCQAIRADGCKVVLSGEGADELLFGYRHFAPYFGLQVDAKSDPAGLGILVTRQAADRLPEHWPAFFSSKYQLGKKIGRFLSLPLQPKEAFEQLLRSSQSATPLETARQAWVQTALSSYILETLSDGAEMAHSVEGRPPFLDHTLWETVSEIPLTDPHKTLLRQAMQGMVAPEIINKPKHPFMAGPLGPPLCDTVRSLVEDCTHPFVDKEPAVNALRLIQGLPTSEQLEWEPALLWLASTYYLQGLWA